MKKPISKSISALALLASSTSAYAMMPPNQTQYRACLAVDVSESGAKFADFCDVTANNVAGNLPINASTGCAEGQAKLVSYFFQVPACAPTTTENQTVHSGCIDIYTREAGEMLASDCDETSNNATLKKKIISETGCAEGQARVTSFNVAVPACMPAGMVQL